MNKEMTEEEVNEARNSLARTVELGRLPEKWHSVNRYLMAMDWLIREVKRLREQLHLANVHACEIEAELNDFKRNNK